MLVTKAFFDINILIFYKLLRSIFETVCTLVACGHGELFLVPGLGEERQRARWYDVTQASTSQF